ncbi:hypothetical protein FJ251_16345 [bacterium]|nr:hypothetical protein [bacterium]
MGEFLILLGAFRAAPVFAILAALGVVLGAVYMLWMVQRVFFGPLTREENRSLGDLCPREWLLLLPLAALMLWIGLYPRPFLGRIEGSVAALLASARPGAAAPVPAAALMGHPEALAPAPGALPAASPSTPSRGE